MIGKKEKLFADFPPVSTSEWLTKIKEDLKGADFDKKLVWRTNEGFNVNPFYRKEDIEKMKTKDVLPCEFPFVRGNRMDNEWLVRQTIEVDDPAEANKKALDVLKRGANSLLFSMPSDKVTASTLKVLLKEIAMDKVDLNFSTCQMHTLDLTRLLVDFFQSSGVEPGSVFGSVNFDPYMRILKAGKDFENAGSVLADLIRMTAGFPNFRVIGVNAELFNNAGAYITQELGFGLSYGNEYLAQAVDAGVPVEEAAGNLLFNFGVGSNYFMEIAKFRAARLLWAKIVEAYKPSSLACAKMKVHAVTSAWNQTISDAYVNLLRSQTEVMSAALAGVDAITVLPFDSAYKPSDEFSERIARNQQLLLKEESHFDKVVDPSAGSYYIENLTESIARQAWSVFLSVEEKGGFYAALKEGFVQSEVGKSSQQRMDAISKRKEILLGTNQFPNLNEKVSEKMETKSAKRCCSCTQAPFLSLDFTRGAESFEELRLYTERAAKRPKVFMLTIGNLAMRLARAQFSGNFFACAGYEIVDNLGFESVEAGVEAARKVAADIVVLCSSDDEYAEYAPKAFDALSSGKEILVVAGAPACMEELKLKGITDYIHVRSNVLDTLRSFHSRLGIC